jgi:hypothetical protein
MSLESVISVAMILGEPESPKNALG